MAITLDSYTTSAGDKWKIKNLPTNRRYGVEIELGFRDGDDLTNFFARMESRRLDNYLMAKTDGSISANYCAEVVTRPLCYLEARRVAKRVLDCALEAPTLSLRGCGVHVHVTRSAWPEFALLYARYAINHTYGANALDGYITAFWDALATRSANDYCVRRPILQRENENETNPHRAVARLMLSWRYSSTHYDAVSYSAHEPTVEFRLFGPTRQARTLASYIDAVDALLCYGVHRWNEMRASNADFSMKWLDFDPVAFAAWVQTKSGYQALKWRLKHASEVKRALVNYRRAAAQIPTNAPEPTPPAPPVFVPGGDPPIISGEIPIQRPITLEDGANQGGVCGEPHPRCVLCRCQLLPGHSDEHWTPLHALDVGGFTGELPVDELNAEVPPVEGPF